MASTLRSIDLPPHLKRAPMDMTPEERQELLALLEGGLADWRDHVNDRAWCGTFVGDASLAADMLDRNRDVRALGAAVRLREIAGGCGWATSTLKMLDQCISVLQMGRRWSGTWDRDLDMQQWRAWNAAPEAWQGVE